MSEMVGRVKKVISYSEMKAFKAVMNELGGKTDDIIIVSKIAEAKKLTKSVVVGVFKLMEVAGVLETRSLGTKGTHIKILNQEAAEAIRS